jgi:hypothetical protein
MIYHKEGGNTKLFLNTRKLNNNTLPSKPVKAAARLLQSEKHPTEGSGSRSSSKKALFIVQKKCCSVFSMK